jgi:hypothetical protein
MVANRRTGALNRLVENPLARVVAYYVLLFAGTALLVELVPSVAPLVSGGMPQTPAEIDAGVRDVFQTGQAPIFNAPKGLPLAEVFAMASAFLLMLPVAWIYIMTRRRKGFLQSVVQTLMILPIVVAGVVFMVKNSLALAFSLGGIVAAVSFRNTLRDTKDAVYIFLATGVGLAAGIQSVGFAAALSVTFNIVILILWYTDFGRAPAGLEGPPAQRRLQRALALSNRTSAFVSLVDDQILKSLTPDQLDSLSERARRRRRSAGDADEVKKTAPMQRLQLRVTGEATHTRAAAETVLADAAKKWEFVRAGPGPDGAGEVLEYRVRLRKSVTAEAFVQRLRAAGGAHLTAVDFA